MQTAWLSAPVPSRQIHFDVSKACVLLVLGDSAVSGRGTSTLVDRPIKMVVLPSNRTHSGPSPFVLRKPHNE